MILHWNSLKEDCPMAVQIIEKKTKFEYDPIYGVLLNTDKDQIQYSHLEGVFDDFGWFMSVYPTEYPGWNGIVTNIGGDRVFADSRRFEEVRSRNHAKSLLAGITIHLFEERMKDAVRKSVPPDAVWLNHNTHMDSPYLGVLGSAELPVKDITAMHLNIDGRGLLESSDFVCLEVKEEVVVLKNKGGDLPYPGFVFKRSILP